MKLSTLSAAFVLMASTFALPATEGTDAAQDVSCGIVPDCSTSDATAMINAAIARGTEVVYVPYGSHKNILHVGNCYLNGRSLAPKGTSSYFRDVGYGARSVLQSCGHGNSVSGENTAGGNGNFLLSVGSGA